MLSPGGLEFCPPVLQRDVHIFLGEGKVLLIADERPLHRWWAPTAVISYPNPQLTHSAWVWPGGREVVTGQKRREQEKAWILARPGRASRE